MFAIVSEGENQHENIERLAQKQVEAFERVLNERFERKHGIKFDEFVDDTIEHQKRIKGIGTWGLRTIFGALLTALAISVFHWTSIVLQSIREALGF